MDSHSDFLEILILGAIAAFLIYRLVSALGGRSGFEQPPTTRSFMDDKAAQDETMPQDIPYKDVPDEDENIPADWHDQIAQIKKTDPSFSWKDFLEGATSAYEMILAAFAKGDKETLKELLSNEIYAEFAGAIDEREAQEQVLQTTLIRMGDLLCEDITQKGTQISIRLRFVTEQTHVVRNKKGTVIEGSSQQVEEIVDIWTFSRDARASNPNWTLVETEN